MAVSPGLPAALVAAGAEFVLYDMEHSGLGFESGGFEITFPLIEQAFTNMTAFSPTDVSAVKPWAKVLVVAESLLSLSLAALVIAAVGTAFAGA